MNEMTSKQRILNSLNGEEVDRVAWSPFLAYYWDFLPEDIRNKGMVDYYKKMEADPLLRGTAQLYSTKINNCTITEKKDNKNRLKIYETPVGNLMEEYTFSSKANSWFLTGHPVKSIEDMKTLIYIYENTDVLENLKDFENEYNSLGEDGLIVPIIGTNCKTAFQSLVEHWCGTVELTYAIYDYPEIVKECLNIMWEKDLKTVDISLKSKAEAFIFWEDSSTTNISPDFFSQYTAPQITQWGDKLHNNDRLLIHHACGHVKDLLPLMAKTPIDNIESISPFPTGNIHMKDARLILPHHIGLIGGIEPTFIVNSSIDELLEYVNELLISMKGSRYILANSDSCPPNVAYEKFVAISKFVKNFKF